MGFISRLVRNEPLTPEVLSGKILEPAPSFSVDIDPGTLYGVQSIDEALQWMQGTARVTRREAITVPAVKRARDLIAGGLGSLPLRMYDQNNALVDWSLLAQPEEGIPSSVSWTSVVDDLLFSKVSWLKVTHVGWHGKPAQVARLTPETVTVQPDLKVFHSSTGNGTALQYVPDNQLIRIDSPNDALLVAGARAIRALGRLEAAALNAAEGVPPNDYFTAAEGADPIDLSDEHDKAKIEAALNAWKTARQTRSTGFVPAALKYNSNAFSPEQLQLVQAREMAISEIARLTGIDNEELGISTTSRTYFNSQDRRKNFLDFVIGPYLKAIEARLSMDDVTPRGFKVRFDTSEFAKADDMTTAQTDEILIRAGVLRVNEVRERRGLEPISEPAPAPAPAREEVAA